MSDDPVLWNIDGRGVATITLNRPERLNALDVPTACAFAEAARAVTAAPGLRVIVLRGAGRAFVAGGDVAAFAADPDRAGQVVADILDAAHEAVQLLHDADAPVIVRVQGVAAGAGLSLVLGADLAVAAADARFLLAYDRIGAPPDCAGTWFMARRLSRATAAELMFLGREYSAEEARAAGIVTHVATPEVLDATVEDMAAGIAAGPTLAYGAFRRVLAEAHGQPLEAQMRREREAFLGITASADFREGITAFAARRKPDFQGR